MIVTPPDRVQANDRVMTGRDANDQVEAGLLCR